MDESLFLRMLLKEKIKVTPTELSSGVRAHITERLDNKCSAKCTKHGYIRRGSIEVLKVSLGRVDMATLNGDVTYIVQFSADVCNPCVGSTLKARIVNSNRFGLLAEAGVRDGASGSYTSVLDIIIAKQTVSMKSEVDLETIHINDEVIVEVMGKKFDLDDPKLSIVGRVLRMNSDDALRPAASVADNASVLDDEDLSEDLADINDDAILSDKDDEEEEEEYDDGAPDEVDGDEEVLPGAVPVIGSVAGGGAVDGSEQAEESESGFGSEDDAGGDFFEEANDDDDF